MSVQATVWVHARCPQCGATSARLFHHMYSLGHTCTQCGATFDMDCHPFRHGGRMSNEPSRANCYEIPTRSETPRTFWWLRWLLWRPRLWS